MSVQLEHADLHDSFDIDFVRGRLPGMSQLSGDRG